MRENVFAEQGFDAVFERNLTRIRSCGQYSGNDLLVFFRLQRAGGVDDEAAGTDCAQCGSENCALTFCLAREVFQAEAMANLRIATQRSSAAARHIGQGQVEDGFFGERGCVGKPTFYAGGVWGEALLQLGKPGLAGFHGDDASFGVALGQDERLAAGSRATIEDCFYFLVGLLAATASQFGHQLRAFVLEAHAAFTEGFRRGDVAGENGSCGGEQLAGFEGDSGCMEFGFDGGASEAKGQHRLALAVMADGSCSIEAVEVDPALYQPSGMSLGESKFFRGTSLRG